MTMTYNIGICVCKWRHSLQFITGLTSQTSSCFCSSLAQRFLFRPPNIHVGGLMFYHIFFLLSFFLSFFRQLPAQLTGRNSTISGHTVGSKCDLKKHVWNVGYPFPLQNGGLKPPFSTISQLRGNFNGLSSKRNMIYISGQVRCKLQGVSYIVSK